MSGSLQMQLECVRGARAIVRPVVDGRVVFAADWRALDAITARMRAAHDSKEEQRFRIGDADHHIDVLGDTINWILNGKVLISAALLHWMQIRAIFVAAARKAEACLTARSCFALEPGSV